MKKFFLILTSVLFVSLLTFAKNIDSTTAMNVANNFYTGKATIKKSVDKQNIRLSLAYTCKSEIDSGILKHTVVNLYYIFNINDNDGFVVVAGDDIVSPILGYSNEGSYTGENIPPDFKYWMEGYKNQILFAKKNNFEANDDIKTKWNDLINNTNNYFSVTAATSVSPLLHTYWAQSPYFNDLCPGGSVTGCVATAMAQIMKYWNFPPHGTGSHSYSDPTYGYQYVDFSTTTYNWPAMPIAVTSANNAVATLMYDCGVGVNMSYSPDASGSYVTSAESPVKNCAEYALKNYFGYNPNTVKGILYRDYSYPYTQIKTILENELNNHRPVQYGGIDATQGGHSWVCDGYDANGYFHMNWGWSGAYNTYFDINALNPSTYRFDTSQEIIIGIIPDTATAPSANFSAFRTTSSCSGVIQFSDSSLHFPTSWLWDFGDGTTDTLENPAHTYIMSGTYTVKLVVFNRHGKDSLIKTNYVVISVPPIPAVTSETICDSGSTTLKATGTGIIDWYNTATGGTMFYTGTSYTTPVLNTSTTYYVGNVVTPSPVYGAKANKSGGGGGYISDPSWYLIFDCYNDLTLISVDVYVDSAGPRIIQLRNSSGTVLHSDTVNLSSSGLHTVTLNFSVPEGTNLQLGLSPSSKADLYRNNSGVSYPYTTAGLLSVTGCSAGSGRYYYFYNWKIQESTCSSARIPVTANVLHTPVASFIYTINRNRVYFTNTSLNATNYFWDFGDGDTSAQANPIHTFNGGNPIVTLKAYNICSQNEIVQPLKIITGIENPSSDNYFNVFPNPCNGIFNLKILSEDSKYIQINIFNVQGKKIYCDNFVTGNKEILKTIDLSSFRKGIYNIELVTGTQVKNKIILLQ